VRLRSIGRSCVLLLSRSARHLAATRLFGTNRRTDPCLAFSVSSFVETPGASKMPHFDFSKRQVPRAPVEPFRIPLETWPSLRLARARDGSMSDEPRPIELSSRRGSGSWREAVRAFPPARAWLPEWVLMGGDTRQRDPKVFVLIGWPILSGWRET